MDGNYLTSSSASLLRETGPHRIRQSGIAPVQQSVKGATYSIGPAAVVKPIRVSAPDAQPTQRR